MRLQERERETEREREIERICIYLYDASSIWFPYLHDALANDCVWVKIKLNGTGDGVSTTIE